MAQTDQADPDNYGRSVWAEDALSDYGITHGMITPGDEGPLGRQVIDDVGTEMIRNLIHLAHATDGTDMVQAMLARAIRQASADFTRFPPREGDRWDAELLDRMGEAIRGVTEPDS